jgi:hypothetical protein
VAAKDKYGNNLRRGAMVSDLRPDNKQAGEVVGTDGNFALVRWEGMPDTAEERVHGSNLLLADKRFR